MVDFLDNTNKVSVGVQATNISSKDKNSIFEYSISIGHHYIGTIFKVDLPKVITNIRGRLVNICNATGFHKTKIILDAFLRGLRDIEKDIEDGKLGKMPEPGTRAHQRWQIAKKNAELLESTSMFVELNSIYTRMDDFEFQEWCNEAGIDYKEFIEWKSGSRNFYDQSESDKNWLESYLKPRGVAKTADIRQAAVSDGLVKDDLDWGRLRKTAERLYLTGGRHGYWNWPD